MSGGLNERLQNLTPEQRAVLEKRLLERRVEGARRNAVPRREVFSPVPLSYSQELLWLLSQFEDRGVAYNAPAAFRLRGSIDAAVLERALAEPEADSSLTTIDLSARKPEEREQELQRILQAESEHPFDLRSDPVMRSTLVKLADDDYVFVHVLHHIATDGYSRAIIFRDLTSLYDNIAAGLPSTLPELEIQYGDYAAWHRNWLDGGVLEQQLDYWKARLAGSPTRLELPTDFARPPVRSAQGDHRSPRRSQRSCIATRARTTSSSERRSQVGTERSSRAWSATSSIRSRYASTSRTIRRSERCWGEHARRRSKRSSMRTFPTRWS